MLSLAPGRYNVVLTYVPPLYFVFGIVISFVALLPLTVGAVMWQLVL